MKVMDVEDITPEQAKRYMQMCYATHATISSMSTDKENEAVVSTWPAQVRAVSREHTRLCNEIMQGKYYKNIEADPRETATMEVDEKIDYKQLSDYKKDFQTQ